MCVYVCLHSDTKQERSVFVQWLHSRQGQGTLVFHHMSRVEVLLHAYRAIGGLVQSDQSSVVIDHCHVQGVRSGQFRPSAHRE